MSIKVYRVALDGEGHPAQLPFPSLDIDRILNGFSEYITPPKSTTTAKQGKQTTQPTADKTANSASSSESTADSAETRAHAEPVSTAGEG